MFHVTLVTQNQEVANQNRSIPCSIAQQATELKPNPKRPIFLTWKKQQAKLTCKFRCHKYASSVLCCSRFPPTPSRQMLSKSLVVNCALLKIHNEGPCLCKTCSGKLGTFLVLMERDSLGLRPSIHVWSEQ